MTWSVDARVAVRFGTLADAGTDDALLMEDGVGQAPPGFGSASFSAVSDHTAGCACCLPRSLAAQALAGLFQARAKGSIPFFRRVLAVTHSAEADAAVWAAVRTDPLVSGRFRLA